MSESFRFFKTERKYFISWTLLALLLLSLTAYAASPLEGKTAPDFALAGMDGQNHRLSEMRGQVVMVNFWATWCGPCREEMPPMNELYQRYKSLGFTILGVNIDDKREAGEKMARNLGISYPVLFDAGKSVSKQYKVEAMPTTILVDRNGKVRHVHFGYKSGYIDEYQKEVRALLAERG